MKIRLSKPNEWGKYIDPETFDIKEIISEVPDKAVVVIQKREFRSELSRSVISTRYGAITKGSLIYVTKREASKRLAKQCSRIMLKTDKIPAHITISEKREESKPIDLTYNFSASDKFPFQITAELLEGQNPKQFLEKIIASTHPGNVEFNSEKDWIIGYAPHGRGLCNKCKKQIREKELRFRLMDSKDSVMNRELFHFKCFPIKNTNPESIHGESKLEEEDQKRLRKLIRS